MTARVLSTEGHVEGRPVSPSTYTNRGCRCEACRAAIAVYRAERRRAKAPLLSQRAHWQARTAAATWVRREHPDVWRRLLDEARLALDAEAGS